MMQYLLLSLLLLTTQAAILATADFIDYADDPGSYAYPNVVGLSMDFPDLIASLENPLLQNYISNSYAFGSKYNRFSIFVNNPGGYKYNCPLVNQIANDTLNCDFDLKNDTFETLLGNFYRNIVSYQKLFLGWDNEGADFTNYQYVTQSFRDFAVDLFLKTFMPPIMQTADKADTYDITGIRPGYTYTQPAEDCSNINQYLTFWYASPGVTQSASKDWYEEIFNIWWYCGYFTARAIVFPDPSQLTIENLLSQTYTSEFIKNRFTVDGTSYVRDIKSWGIMLNDLRLVDSYQGVNGLTNSFAAAIWAIEFTMEWIIKGGGQFGLFNPIKNPSFQSVLGQAPLFKPSPLYYALLFTLIANNNSPYVMIPKVTSGTSNKIKAYGFDDYGTYGVLILNKDTSPSANGTVDVKISITTGLRCMYLSAPSLSSTEGISFNGYSFVSNSSFPEGEFVSRSYEVNSNGMYSVPLNYSQVVFCKTTLVKKYPFTFPRYSETNGSQYISFFLSILLLLIII